MTNNILAGKLVSVVIPTYNEKDNIVPLVEKINESLIGYNYEIVFVDDNSKDGTAQAATALQAKYPVRVLVRKNERGLASAVVHGLKATDAEFAIVMDADLQHPPSVLPEMIKALETNDVVVGSRYCLGGNPGDRTISRRMISIVANLLALPLVPKVKDRMTGLFAFRRSIVGLESLNAVGWKIGLEVMVRSHAKSIVEVPYTFVPRVHGTSKLSRRIMWQYLQQLFRLYMQKYRILNFMLVGGIGYGVNMLTYWPLTLFFKNEVSFLGQTFYLPPFVISSLIAIACNYSLNKIWTFKGWSEQRLGGLRYLFMASATLLLDMALLFVLVEYGKLPPVPAAALAILVVFVIRYVIAKSWVWLDKTPKS